MSPGDAELHALDHVLDVLSGRAQVDVLCRVSARNRMLPVYAIDLSPGLEASAPVVVFVGGVHGLENIGVQVLLSHLESLSVALEWDAHLADLLQRVRVVFLPIINPTGLVLRWRSNANGVDLMRNAPVDSYEPGSRLAFFRGHRLGPFLPYYRGAAGAPMEPEARALCAYVRRVVLSSKFAITLDVHSGFYGKDRLWFPYARTRSLWPHAPEVLALKELLDSAYPIHNYVVEPQSKQYTTHGDLWDYLYDTDRAERPDRVFLPLTLEMGASSWLRKNPRQIFDRQGIFHPMKPHRVDRTLRRHVRLLELLTRLAASHARWLPKDDSRRVTLAQRAALLWG